MAESLGTLDALIDGYLAGTTPFETLESRFAPCYLFMPEEAFPDVETEVWYGVVHERIEWTTAEPSDEQRSFGWMTIADFRIWLEEAVRTKPGRG
jgi:hypothetical protein